MKNKLYKLVEYFNSLDDEMYVGDIPNSEAYEFLSQNIPLLDCPDKSLEMTYYFRFWAYRKHIKNTPEGRVITEFFPDVSWAKKYNTVNCAAGAHILEGRWLREQNIVHEYISFWYNNVEDTLNYTSWIADAAYRTACLTGNFTYLNNLLPNIIKSYEMWEKGFIYKEKHPIGKKENGLYRNIDDRDGTECSIGGNGYRPTLNSAMHSHAKVIAKIASHLGETDITLLYNKKANDLKSTYKKLCWNSKLDFFTVLKDDGVTLADVCELIGYAPWLSEIVEDKSYDKAWARLMKKDGFNAPYGLTHAVQNHKDFALNYTGHHCQWNGPSWPLTTSATLDTLSRMLQKRECEYVDREDYCTLLSVYANSHRRTLDDGRVIPWIDENLHPYTGDWISRTIINTQEGEVFKGKERGREYNHSSFCDLVLGGLIGIVPNEDDTISIIPMINDKRWHYFSVTQLKIKENNVDIYFDKNGDIYDKGKGLFIYSNTVLVASSEKLCDIHNINLCHPSVNVL